MYLRANCDACERWAVFKVIQKAEETELRCIHCGDSKKVVEWGPKVKKKYLQAINSLEASSPELGQLKAPEDHVKLSPKDGSGHSPDKIDTST